MTSTKLHRLAVTGLALSLAAVAAPAGSASFPDYDGQRLAGVAAIASIADKVRYEPLPAPPGGRAATIVTVRPQADGFDWADAGIGAAIALGAGALAGGAVLVVRRTGHRDRLATH